MKKLLIVVSAAEVVFGLLVVIVPSVIARLLLATDISGAAVTVGRGMGACLVALGFACWPRGEVRREFYIMLTWSVLATCLLVADGLCRNAGVLLWPAAVAHGAVATLLFWTRSRAERTA